jgi:hypothetical protein
MIALTVAEVPPYAGETTDMVGAFPEGVTETVTDAVGVITGIEEI